MNRGCGMDAAAVDFMKTVFNDLRLKSDELCSLREEVMKRELEGKCQLISGLNAKWDELRVSKVIPFYGMKW